MSRNRHSNTDRKLRFLSLQECYWSKKRIGSRITAGRACENIGGENHRQMALNWNDLKVMLAVARSGSLARASVMLGMDQSTTGRRLSALEAELGTLLFVRTKSGVMPNEACEKLMQHAIEVERRMDRIAEDASADAKQPAGIVRLLSNSWILERLANTVLGPFMEAHPKLSLRMITFPPVVQTRSDTSISLWFEAPPLPGEFAIKLGDVPYAIYAAKNAEPDQLDWVSFFDEDAPRRVPVRAWEKARKRGDFLRMTATDAQLLGAIVRAGIGKGILPICLADKDPHLVRIGEDNPDLVRTLHLHAHPDTVQNLRAQTTIRWLRESFDKVFREDS